MAILTAAERIGTTLAGKYRLDRVLGAGGMGTVFAGVHSWTGRDVAVKMLNPDYATDATVVQRFLQEARAAARLHHPNVVDVLDMGQSEDGAVYLVLELMTGFPLKEIVARGAMSVEDALTHLLPVIDALAVAHAQGIVHRDLKPDNIFLAQNGQGTVVPKLLDFGIAKVAGSNTAKTGTGFIVGTPQYMSPEQALGKSDLGPPSDVWSMGVVLFECLTGQLPFQSESPTGMLIAIVTQRAPAVSSLGAHVPPQIAAVIDRALLTDPLARFQNGGELAQALHSAAGSAGLSVIAPRREATASQRTGAHPMSPPSGVGPAVAAAPTGAGAATGGAQTPFTWAGEDSTAVDGLPKRSFLPWILAGGTGMALAAVVVGVVVMVASRGAEQAATAQPTGSGTTADPLVVPAVQPLAPLPVNGAPALGASVAAQAPDAGPAQLPASPRAERGTPTRGKAPPPAVGNTLVRGTNPVLAQPVPVAPPPPEPRDPPPRRPPSERGANGSLILD